MEATHLTFEAVQRIVGKGRRTLTRLLKEKRLEKIGRGRGSRISLESVMRYLEEEKQAAKAVNAVSAMSGVNMAKARAILQKKREEEKLRRALENIDTEGKAANATVDPRFEACVYDGVCMTVAERDGLIAREQAIRRARQLGFRSVPGI